MSGFEGPGFMELYLDIYLKGTPATSTKPHALITYRKFWWSDTAIPAPFGPGLLAQ